MEKPPMFVCVLFEGLTTDSVSMTMGDLCNVLECRVKVANSGNIRYVKSLSVLGGCCVRECNTASGSYVPLLVSFPGWSDSFRQAWE